ncbi:MAG TPA: vanadium-dependent haloperoxidase [Mucilaginibacter sp.]|nr:vanadium-dependent haloperoxidase [Mucilaginibacter sp.]
MKKKALLLIILFAAAILNNSCKKNQAQPTLTSNDITKVINQMSVIMIHDITNPPLAARFFSYTCLAGYEVVSENDKTEKSMHGVLNEYPDIKKPSFANGYNYQLSAVIAMMETAGKLQPSGSDLMVKYEQSFLDSCRKIGFTDEVIDSSKHYGQAISKKILAYAKKDKYNRISNYTRYTPLGKDSTWYPTPPAYMAPVEPYFNTIRPFTLDSSSQFKVSRPIRFSTDKQSEFYKYMQRCYKLGGSELTPEHKTIAAFWDCNPFAVQDNGHMLIGLKKISPGAHWLGITGIVCNQTKTSFSKALEIHTVVSIGLMDSFMCCWDEKYRSNRIRPETAIRKYIDPNWRPLLQTPPFPEYLSGHSCISSTSAVILTSYFGDNLNFTDNVEQKYGLAPRSFTSFNQAAAEAGMSRFWGGIHFEDAINSGMKQGTQVGEWVVNKVKGNK